VAPKLAAPIAAPIKPSVVPVAKAPPAPPVAPPVVNKPATPIELAETVPMQVNKPSKAPNELPELAATIDLSPPKPAERKPVELIKAVPPVIDISEPEATSIPDDEPEEESETSQPLVGVLETPSRFAAARRAALVVPQATEPQPSSKLVTWIREHKVASVAALVVAWIVFAVIQKFVHPPEMSRAYLEEMALRKQVKAMYDEKAAQKAAAEKEAQGDAGEKKADEKAAK
jgi:hypothetical protein